MKLLGIECNSVKSFYLLVGSLTQVHIRTHIIYACCWSRLSIDPDTTIDRDFAAKLV